jgi:hypothetical protein
METQYWFAMAGGFGGSCPCQGELEIGCDCKGYYMGSMYGAFHGIWGRLATVSCEPLKLKGKIVTYDGFPPGEPYHDCGCDFGVTIDVVVEEIEEIE